MRPLTANSDDRVTAPRRGKPGGANGAARARSGPAAKRRKPLRRKPVPMWLKPALLIGAGVLSLAVVGGIALWLQYGGYMQRTLAWGDRVAGGVVAGLGLTINEVTLEGRERTAVKDILAAVGVRRGDPVLSFDIDGARSRLEALGWVRKASVERRLPDTIHVRLEERRPFALWQRGGRVVLIDREGAVITDKRLGDFPNLLLVVGNGAEKRFAALYDVLQAEPALWRRVETAVLVRKRRWDVAFDNGVSVLLPENAVDAAWRRLATLERRYRLLERDLTAIDLRIPDRLAVRLTPGAAATRRAPEKNT